MDIALLIRFESGSWAKRVDMGYSQIVFIGDEGNRSIFQLVAKNGAIEEG